MTGRCLHPHCRDDEHITVETHIACCPDCHTPLVGDGYCPEPYCRRRGVVEVEWTWLPRAVFDRRDLPPENGWQPLKLPEGLR